MPKELDGDKFSIYKWWSDMDGTGKAVAIIVALFVLGLIASGLGYNISGGSGPADPSDNFMERPY